MGGPRKRDLETHTSGVVVARQATTGKARSFAGRPPFLSPPTRVHRHPPLDVRTQPELDLPIGALNHRSWHVGVAGLVDADRVPMLEAEEISDGARIDQVLSIHARRHPSKITSVIGSVPRPAS